MDHAYIRRSRAKKSAKTGSRLHRAVMEAMESRVLLSGTTITLPLAMSGPLQGSATYSGLTPAQMRGAYGLGTFGSSPITFGSVQGDGSGQTIAIVDAYDDPNASSDLQAFDAAFGLPNAPSFQKLNQNGQTTSLPGTDPAGPGDSWAVEESLDIEWAHVMAPKANIILFESNDNSYANLLTAVQTAANTPGVDVVSLSWGSGEFSGETSYDSVFTTPTGHLGGAASVGGADLPGNIAFFASSGDTGGVPTYPSTSPNIISVGGTTLTLNGNSYVSESAWSGGGGGVSSYETQPSYQHGVVTQSSTQRTSPDVSADADPNSGVPVYDTWDFGATTPWFDGTIGGTSLASPLWAGMTAVIDQGLIIYGASSISSTQLLSELYQSGQALNNPLHDVTTGSNGFPAGPGYDLATGLGTPNGPNLVSYIINNTKASTIFVDSTATGLDNGTSGVNAFTTMQQALSAAQADETASPGLPISILVAQGTYSPGSSASSTFQMIDNVAIYGGFANGQSATPWVRNVSAYPTIFTGSGVNNHVVTASGTNSSALIDGITITGGQPGAVGTYGGGILNIGGTPTINGCTFQTDTAAYGGAIYNSGVTLTITNCTFNNNLAYSFGGAIDDDSSQVTLLNCTFTSNFAGGYGGALAAFGGSLSLSNGTFTSDSSGGEGGAIYDSSSAVSAANCTFTSGSSSYGAAIFAFGSSSSAASLNLSNSQFSQNSTAYYAGAIYDGNYCTTTINGSSFTNNRVVTNPWVTGGAIYFTGSSAPATITNTTFTSNSSAAYGGAIADNGAPLTLTSDTFTSNSAVTGGAIYDVGGSLTLASDSFTTNSATSGGAIDDSAGAMSIAFSTFTRNSAASGGAIQNLSVAAPGITIAQSSFYGNSASSNGGAIDNETSSTQTIINSAFVGNIATTDGGAIYNHSSSSSLLINDTLTSNSASAGAAIYGASNSPSIVVNSILWLNTGGDIAQDNSSSASSLTNSDTDQSGYFGNGNLYFADPQFVRVPNVSVGDYGNLQLNLTSPAINTGSNSALPSGDIADLANHIRVWNGTVDMGAYEADTVPVNTIYVDVNATGANNGTSWNNAYTSLKSALVADTIGAPIYVGQGTYTLSSDPNDTFQMVNNVAIYGGFAGTGTANPYARNPGVYVSTLSGGGNHYHVVTAGGTNSSAVLDGFTITRGFAEFELGTPQTMGGGLYDLNGSPTINDCVFVNNTAIVFGGAMSLLGSSSPIITNCTFTSNTGADEFGGAVGIDLTSGSIASFQNCSFSNNNCFLSGGAVAILSSQAVFTDCSFTGNTSFYGGAAFAFNEDGPVTGNFINCLFANNTAKQFGDASAVYATGSTTSVNLINDTITQNVTQPLPPGAGSVGCALYYSTTVASTVVNCVIWNNSAMTNTEITAGSNVSVTYSDVDDGGYAGTGNINTNPLFVNPSGGNFQLQSGSPCIATGSTAALPSGDTSDLAGHLRVWNGSVDMGAYESDTIPFNVIYVDASATGANNGTSWNNAYTSLQQALNADTTGAPIYVGQGTYNPGGSQATSFEMASNIALYGGFAGTGAANPYARNPGLYITTLSGGSNHDHVVVAAGTDNTAILDGFTITGGAAFDGYPGSGMSGGGLYILNASPTINNCVFSSNVGVNAAGLYVTGTSSPLITNSAFNSNTAYSNGGAVFVNLAAATFQNCTFNSNYSPLGGAVQILGSQALFTDCAFTNNTGIDGGAVDVQYSNGAGSGEFVNCLFAGNIAGPYGDGGALYSTGAASFQLINDTFSQNSSYVLPGQATGSILYLSNTAQSTLVNCILWGDNAANEIRPGSLVSVTYSDVYGGFVGTGNINANPLFVNPASGNYQLQAGSPVIDAGSNAALPSGDTTDLAGNPRIVNGIVDMGAYEY